MGAQQANNEAINVCLAEIALLRKELEWIGETTKDPEIKFKVHSILRRSLEMPPQEND